MPDGKQSYQENLEIRNITNEILEIITVLRNRPF